MAIAVSKNGFKSNGFSAAHSDKDWSPKPSKTKTGFELSNFKAIALGTPAIFKFLSNAYSVVRCAISVSEGCVAAVTLSVTTELFSKLMAL